MVKTCKKCGSTSLGFEMLACGNTAQRCPICGEQNYSFGTQFMKTDGATHVYDLTCHRCGDVFFLNYKGERKYCDDCLSIVRSEQSTKRNLNRKAKGELSLSQFYYRKLAAEV